MTRRLAKGITLHTRDILLDDGFELALHIWQLGILITTGNQIVLEREIAAIVVNAYQTVVVIGDHQ